MMRWKDKKEWLQGLTEDQVKESAAKYGVNELERQEPASLWSMFLGAFDDIWIKVLCAALALKVILAVLGIFVPALSGGNDVVEIISIVIAIALATGFSTLSEYRNTSRSEALQEEYSKTYAKVVRDGKLVNILTSEIVKGDTILIQAGDKVPADGLLFEGKIKVSQAALNGESRDENKAAVTNMDEAESTDYSSQGKVFMGSVVTSGEGYMIATVIGDSSELGKINKPILLKRGLAATIEEWLMSAEYIMAGGNENVILCERGIRTYETAMRNTLDLSAIPMIKKKSHLPVMVDPSHATGIRDMVEPMALAAIAAGADGLMVEVHNDPAKALCDGPQSLTPEQFDTLMKKVNKTREFFQAL